MSMAPTGRGAPERKGRRKDGKARPSARKVNYRQLRNPFTPVPVFSSDRIDTIRETALRVLEELGMKVLLPQARAIFRAIGALVDDDTQMVRIGRDIIAAALASAPRSFRLIAGNPERDLTLELGTLAFVAGAGAPNASDLVRGRRASTLSDFEDIVRLSQAFDVLQVVNQFVEAGDISTALRHYAVNRAQLTLSDKVPGIFSRGTQQVQDSFQMVRIARGLSREAFDRDAYCYTVINTNSPRQLDIPMAQGLIDFAAARQMSIITPFCLMGAMAPVTVAGALTLSHAEALASIALTQLVRPGAPICYGSFSSNVDMHSGAPAFGTPEQFQASLGTGQLARKLGLPWRGAAGCAANINDAQAANETQMSLWGAVLAGCTVIIHSAGWIEGGLTFSYEKLITDLEVVQVIAELCAGTAAGDAEIAYDAIAEVQPGGHFFAARHTMERYQTAFYEPLVADWSNFGTWTERGAKDASHRATGIWQEILRRPKENYVGAARTEELDAFVARRTGEGGAPPVS
jgi:trimethylamine--corrinoid protein Co-methyltransferase